MIVDASALLAIILEEPEGEAFKNILASGDEQHSMSPVNYAEAAARLNRLGLVERSAELDLIMTTLRITIAAIMPDQAKLARQAQELFGRGNHPAKLNLGDCFAYALEKARGEPLLFKGDDFRHTDVEAVL